MSDVNIPTVTLIALFYVLKISVTLVDAWCDMKQWNERANYYDAMIEEAKNERRMNEHHGQDNERGTD